ncbi:hypothetical protein ONZ45_g3741 [Pleurotus djamor]|nr:hypothetical protein ONZ45_g3741 [Pleurotus djamor]
MAKSNAKGKTPVRHNNGTSKSKGRLAEKGTPPPALQPDRPPLSHPPPPPPTFPLPEVVEEVRAELAAKAQELYQKMDPLIPRPLRERDSVSIGAEGLAIGDEQYWASVPQHIRNAVMKYYSSPPLRQQNGLDMKEVELHALAQKLVDGGFVDEHGVGPNIGLPFDPSMLENSAFDQYIKDAAATLVPIPPDGLSR